ncbi:hypothetical protein DICVIV_04952 [Dictyocaulus viviparus]|uniref:Uncharacterized protein n=1 Tax=Dictyocaulus viviparus TaxID=29172 RepID=A0A0D8XWA7_DICVI|nr:hypothetical protein DICVIV_04952 [Dictyocaulus viviparus]
MIRIQIYLIFSLISCAFASLAFYNAKAGDRVVLDLGKDVQTWMRVRDSDIEEFIKYCKVGDKEPRCFGFVTEAGKPTTPKSNARVDKDGKLIIDPVKLSDAGTYSSPDQKPILKKNRNGGVSAVLNTQITLEVKS